MSRFVFALAAALPLICAQTAHAAPMKCSGEEKTCLTACSKFPVAVAKQCSDTCRTRFNFCRSTGCWDNGRTRYCGLLRQ